MFNLYLIERLLHEREHELARELVRQDQRSAALAGQRQRRTHQFTLLSTVRVGVGTRLVCWGNAYSRLTRPPAPRERAWERYSYSYGGFR